jgi:hypothetical protein
MNGAKDGMIKWEDDSTVENWTFGDVDDCSLWPFGSFENGHGLA